MKKKKNKVLNVLKRLTQDELFLEVKKSSPSMKEEDFKKIIKVLKTLNYFESDDYFKGSPKVFSLYDAKLINDIYTQSLKENTKNYNKIATKIFKESNLKDTIEKRDSVDKNGSSEEIVNPEGFIGKSLSFLENTVTKLNNSDKLFKWIKRILFFSVVIFVGSYTYINIQSNQSPGIKKDYEIATNSNIKDLSSFTIAYKYSEGKEEHAVFTYLKEDGFYAGDLNIKTKEITGEGKIDGSHLTADNPIIYSQLLSWIGSNEKNLKLTKMKIVSDDEILINDQSYKLKIDGTKLVSVNGNEIPFQNIVMTQFGQKDLLNKYEVDESKIDYFGLTFNEEKELYIRFTVKGVNAKYILKTDLQEKVYLDIIHDEDVKLD